MEQIYKTWNMMLYNRSNVKNRYITQYSDTCSYYSCKSIIVKFLLPFHETELYISNIQKRHLQRQLWRSLQAGLLTGEDSTFLLPLYRAEQAVRLQGTDIQPAGEKHEQALVLTADDYSALLTTTGNLNFYQNSPQNEDAIFLAILYMYRCV